MARDYRGSHREGTPGPPSLAGPKHNPALWRLRATAQLPSKILQNYLHVYSYGLPVKITLESAERRVYRMCEDKLFGNQHLDTRICSVPPRLFVDIMVSASNLRRVNVINVKFFLIAFI